ncbi:MAG: transglycosylase domain-containing protein, partial [Gemmatimonadota bacterium]
IYLGHVGGEPIRGIGRAARVYLGKDASRLRLDESALLAGLIRAPNLYAPHESPEAARRRRDRVIRAMAEWGAIDRATRDRALATPLEVRPVARPEPFAPYFADYLRTELAARFPVHAADTAGVAVVGTISPFLQTVAEDVVRRGLKELERRYPHQARRDVPLQAALVALDPRSGDILAMVGGRDFEASQFDRSHDARRQPGSVFKPIVVLAALADAGAPGGSYELTSVLEDAPLSVPTDEGLWEPTNHDGEFRGPVTLRGALVASRNLPFVRLGLEIGPGRIVRMARALGIRSPLRPVPSLALGSSEVTLLEITGAYAVLAAGGVRAPPRAILEITDRDGRLAAASPERTRVIDGAVAARLTDALQAVVRWGTGRGVRERGYHGLLAAKSGSTDGYRDAWFVGYTPDLAVGVWVGFDDGTPVGLPGNVAALPMFADFLIAARGAAGAGSGPDGFTASAAR